MSKQALVAYVIKTSEAFYLQMWRVRAWGERAGAVKYGASCQWKWWCEKAKEHPVEGYRGKSPGPSRASWHKSNVLLSTQTPDRSRSTDRTPRAAYPGTVNTSSQPPCSQPASASAGYSSKNRHLCERRRGQPIGNETCARSCVQFYSRELRRTKTLALQTESSYLTFWTTNMHYYTKTVQYLTGLRGPACDLTLFCLPPSSTIRESTVSSSGMNDELQE